MFTGINVAETKRITLECDPHKDNPTQFIVGVYDSFLLAHIKDSATRDDAAGTRFDMHRANLLMVKFGLRGVENFADLKFEIEDVTIAGRKYPAVKDDVLAAMPAPVIGELAMVLLQAVGLTGEEAKN